MRLFVYGTLTDPTRVELVTGRRFASRPAMLSGWERRRGAHGYPVIHRRDGATVEGLVLDGIDADALRALDAYEDVGRLYVRRPVRAAVAGRSMPCEAYVCPDAYGPGHCSRSRNRYCP